MARVEDAGVGDVASFLPYHREKEARKQRPLNGGGRRGRGWFGATVVFVLFAAGVGGYHLLNDRPSSMDETKHLQLAMDYRDWLVDGVPLQNPWAHVYPPLYHLSIIPALSCGIPTETKAVATHAVYGLIFLIGCLLLGRSHQRPDGESLAAALLTLGYCYVLWAARRALIDFPLMTWTALAMALLARTEGFESRRRSLWFGVALGAGLLIKFTFAFFFALPVLCTVATGRGAARYKNAVLAMIIAGFVGGSWYFWNSAFFLDKASGLVNEVTTSGADPHTLAGWFFYLRQWPNQLGTPNMIFTAIGLVLALASLIRQRRRDDGFLWAWFLSGYMILSAMMNKDLRHTLPMLPAVALLAARGWNAALPGLWRGRFLWAAALLLFGWTAYSYDRPAKEDWKLAEMGRLLARTHDASQPFLAASVVSHQPRFFARGLKWFLRTQHLSLKTTGTGDPESSFVEYIFVRQSPNGAGSPDVDREWKDAQPESRAFKATYSQIGQFSLPDKSQVLVYQRSPHPHYEVVPRTEAAVAAHLTRILKRWIEGPLKVSVRSTPQGLVDGRLQEIRASCEGCRIEGVSVESADIIIEKPWLNLYNVWDQNEPGLLAFDSVGAHLVLNDAEAVAALSKVRGVTDPQVDFVEGKIRLRARFRGIPVQALVRPEIRASGAHPYARAILETVSIAGIPMPGWIIGKASRQTLWLEPQPSFPGRVAISRITLNRHRLVLE